MLDDIEAEDFNNNLRDIFDNVATATQKPQQLTLPQLIDAIRFKFNAGAFKTEFVGDSEVTITVILLKNRGDNIRVTEADNGTFNVNVNGQEQFKRVPPELAVQALARFYGEHTNHPAPKVPEHEPF